MYEYEEEEEYGMAYLEQMATRTDDPVRVVWTKPVRKVGVVYGIGGLPISV